MTRYEKVHAPKDVVEKAQQYAEKHIFKPSSTEKTVLPIRYPDGTQAFEVSHVYVGNRHVEIVNEEDIT